MGEFETDYQAWFAKYDCYDEADRTAMRAHIASLGRRPLFLVVPLIRAGDSPTLWLPVLEAVRSQIYPNWRFAWPSEWSKAAISQLPEMHRLELSLAQPEPEMERRAFLASAIVQPMASAADFVVPLVPGALLDERALYEFATASAKNRNLAVLYADEDQVDGAGGRRHTPRFKTQFDVELMQGRDALGLPVAYDRSLLLALGGFGEGVVPIGIALYDLGLRVSEAVLPDQICHVPMVLCHRITSVGAAADWDAVAAREAVRRHLARTGEVGATVTAAPLAPAWVRVEHALPNPHPLVSIIVPTRDSANLLTRCADAVLHRTNYAAIELLIVDNGTTAPDALNVLTRLSADTRVQVLHCPGPFNYSALNNAAAHTAQGEILVLLNNDTDVLSPGWLQEMVSQALRPGIGAVGAKLLYEDKRIQHAGVVLGNGQMISHQLRLSGCSDPGPMGELALVRSVLAVTGACLAVRREAFLEIGGLDEENLAVAFNDIDFCLRLADHGYRNIWTPFAELLHLESASRGDDSMDEARKARSARELAFFSQRWSFDMRVDPFHNPNIVYGWSGTGFATSPRRRPSWLA